MAFKVLNIVVVFMAGFVTGINLATMRYGTPDHYQASWVKAGVALILAIFFAVYIIVKTET